MKDREYIRHPSNIPIEYQIDGVAIQQKEYLQNFGAGGLSFQSNVYIEQGSSIMINIPNMNPPSKVKGIVLWCYKNNEHFDVGVKFEDSKTAFRVRMAEQICYIEEYRKRVLKTEGRVLSGKEAAIEWIKKYADDFPKIGK